MNNQFIRVIAVVATLFAVGIVYDKYKDKVEETERIDNYEKVQQYLLNDHNLVNNKKPVLWIHSEYEVNARDWESFYSRNNTNINQPYLYLTIKSIIDKCGSSFNICLIDDNSFVKLLPGWSVSLNHVGNPLKKHLRFIGICKLLDYYGGFYIPNSLLVKKDLIDIYNQGVGITGAGADTNSSGVFTVENVSNTITSSQMTYFPDARFLGSTRDNPLMKELLLYVENLHSNDLTSEQDFLGEVNKWLYQKTLPNNTSRINVIDSKYIGVKCANNNYIGIEKLLGEDYIQFHPNCYAIYIPSDKILSRNKYEWYANLNVQQVLECNAILSKHMLTNKDN